MSEYVGRLAFFCLYKTMLLKRVFRLGCRCEQILWKRFIRMSSASQTPDHLQRTAHNTRQEVVSGATVISIHDESPTVKSLDMKIHNPHFSFKAGQWVDTHIPGVDTVGGFSMCSSPGRLHTDGVLQLAVKQSPHPPAHWVHTKCKVGDQVELRVGGDYFYDPKAGAPPHSLLLVAGGVGINPLISMMNHIHDLSHNQTSEAINPVKTILLFSAKTKEEILFRNHIDELCKDAANNMSSVFFVTAEKCKEVDNIICNHINEQNIKDATNKLQPQNIECYLCGPSPMIESIESMLRKCGISDSSIHYERWWMPGTK